MWREFYSDKLEESAAPFCSVVYYTGQRNVYRGLKDFFLFVHFEENT